MSNRKEYIVRKIPKGYAYTRDTYSRVMDGWAVIDTRTGEQVKEIYPTEKAARWHADKATVNHEHPEIFFDTKIAALLRHCLRASPDWVPQAELSRVYGVGEYGRSDLYHRQAGDKRWIVYRDVDTGRIGKPRRHWRDGVTPGHPIVKREWRWNLGTIPEYFQLLTDAQLLHAFTFCEDGMMHQVRRKLPNGQLALFENQGYFEGGKVFTSVEQWGQWLQYVNNEIKRRGNV